MEKLYRLRELTNADWFPYKDRTIRKLIKDGRLKALDTSTGGNMPVYMVKQSEVERFLKSLEV